MPFIISFCFKIKILHVRKIKKEENITGGNSKKNNIPTTDGVLYGGMWKIE